MDKGNRRRTDRKMQKCVSCDGSHLSGDEGCRGSSKKHIRTKQVTDKERSTNIHVTDV